MGPRSSLRTTRGELGAPLSGSYLGPAAWPANKADSRFAVCSSFRSALTDRLALDNVGSPSRGPRAPIEAARCAAFFAFKHRARVAPGGARCRRAGAAVGGCARRLRWKPGCAAGAAELTACLPAPQANTPFNQRPRVRYGRAARYALRALVAALRPRNRASSRHPFMRAGTAHRLGRRSEAACSRCATAFPLPSRVRAGRVAHEGMAPAMVGQAAQRGYESTAQRGRIEPRDRI